MGVKSKLENNDSVFVFPNKLLVSFVVLLTVVPSVFVGIVDKLDAI